MSNRIRHLGSLLLTALICMSAAHADPVVSPLPDTTPASADALLQTILGTGLTVVPGSVQYQGAASASGTFSNGGTGPTGLGIDSGAVLTTGDARFIAGSAAFPGDVSNKSGTFTAGVLNSLTPNASGGNPLLDTLTPFGTQNASVLTFSFLPTADTLHLSLVFGSEDYNDLVNSGFPTDVFGLFINGVNYGFVPGTTTPISASGINCGGPTSGPAPGTGPNCGLYRDNPPFFDSIISELDGMTVVLDLAIPVHAGAVNTMSIGIADALDDSGDSALMIRAGSLFVPEPSVLLLSLTALGFVGVARRRSGSAK